MVYMNLLCNYFIINFLSVLLIPRISFLVNFHFYFINFNYLFLIFILIFSYFNKIINPTLDKNIQLILINKCHFFVNFIQLYYFFQFIIIIILIFNLILIMFLS
jgi:hypothetical protein